MNPTSASNAHPDDPLDHARTVIDALVESLADARDAASGRLAPERDAAMRDTLLGRMREDRARDDAAKPAEARPGEARPAEAAAPSTGIAGLLTRPVPAHDWQPIWPGVALHVLHDHGEAQSFLLRLEAGAAIPPHAHEGEELCVVLEGEIELDDTVGRPGTFHLALPGSRHRNLRTRTGCLLYLRASLDHGMRF